MISPDGFVYRRPPVEYAIPIEQRVPIQHRELATANKKYAKRNGKNQVYPPNDDPPPPPVAVAVELAGPHRLPKLASEAAYMLHLHDSTCLDCFDRLRQDHDRAQEQAFTLIAELGVVENELQAMADRLSRYLSTKPLVSDG